MTWDNWVFVYKMTQNTASLLAMSMGVLGFFAFNKLNTPYKLLCINFIIAAIGEAIGWGVYVFKWFTIPSINIVNHFFIISESILIGSFFLSFVVLNLRRYTIILLIAIIIGFDLFTVITRSLSEDANLTSAVLSGLLCVAGLLAFYELSTAKTFRRFGKQPSMIVTSGYIVIYALLLFIYFILPVTIDYSQLLAVQLIIAKNIALSTFHTTVLYGIWLQYKQSNRFKPTAFPVL